MRARTLLPTLLLVGCDAVYGPRNDTLRQQVAAKLTARGVTPVVGLACRHEHLTLATCELRLPGGVPSAAQRLGAVVLPPDALGRLQRGRALLGDEHEPIKPASRGCGLVAGEVVYALPNQGELGTLRLVERPGGVVCLEVDLTGA